MTITFHCPYCDELIAFDNKHCGKRARCLSCRKLFIIPSDDKAKPVKIEFKDEKMEPMPGFFKSLFIDTWKIFIDSGNITTLVFVAAVVCFRFFLAKACCLNVVAYVVIWGWLLGFYLNVIYETAFEVDALPQIYLGTSFTFVWYIFKPFVIFLLTIAVVQLPFIIIMAMNQDRGLTYVNMWHDHTTTSLILRALFIFGWFLFPMAILTAAVGRDPALFRPDRVIKPILKAPGPYITVVAILVVVTLMEIHTKQYTHLPFIATTGHLALNLLVQVGAIVSMRGIGLFYRHYDCYFTW